MTLIWRTGFNGITDPDALNYITAVEAADGQLIEFAVARAVNDFIVGCKLDGTWTAIKAACIMAGARTLAGALVPLVGPAPTNVGFVAGDYNRKTGLKGNGTSKYLNSNRSENADPLSNTHWAVFPTEKALINSAYIGTEYAPNTSLSGCYRASTSPERNYIRIRNINQPGEPITGDINTNQILGASRSSSASYQVRFSNSTQTVTATELAPKAATYRIFAEVTVGFSVARISFYSIGEFLDLALLDARLTTLMNALLTAIP